MQCKSLWIKASAKCINVNVNVVLDGFESVGDAGQSDEYNPTDAHSDYLQL